MDDCCGDTIPCRRMCRPFFIHKIDSIGTKLPTPRSGHRCVSDDANLYSFGGYNPNPVLHQDSIGPLFRELWRFNYATKCWARVDTTGVMPHELASHAAVLSGRHLLVYGGTGIPFGNASSNTLHVCDLSTYTWSELQVTGELPPKLYGQSMNLIDGRIYVYGGTTGFDYTSEVHCLDLRTHEWKELKAKGEKPTERYRHEVASDKHHLYIFGGGMATANFDFEKIPAFNIDTCEWHYIPSIPDIKAEIDKQPGTHSPGIPCARKYHSLVQLGQDVYICGGYNEINVFPDIWKVTLPTMHWHRLKHKLPQPVFFHSASLTQSGCMYIFGGVTQIDQKKRTADVYRMWLKVPSLKEIAWEVLLQHVQNVNNVPRNTWLKLGIPLDFVERIDYRAQFG